MIQNDGGRGDIRMVTPPRLEIFDAFLEEQFDVCWVFLALGRSDCPTTRHSTQHLSPDGLSSTLTAIPATNGTRRNDRPRSRSPTSFPHRHRPGYREASQHPPKPPKYSPKESTMLTLRTLSFITQACKTIAPTFLNATGQWGIMQQDRWESYLQWLSEHHLLKTENNQSPTSNRHRPQRPIHQPIPIKSPKILSKYRRDASRLHPIPPKKLPIPNTQNPISNI